MEQEQLLPFLQEFLDRMSGFPATFGFRLTDYKDGRLCGEVSVRPEYCNTLGTAHGGFICTVVDTFGSLACVCESDNIHEGTKGSTVSCNVNFFQRIQGPTIRCEAYILNNGRHLKTCQIDLYDNDGQFAVSAVATYYFIEQKEYSDEFPLSKDDCPSGRK